MKRLHLKWICLLLLAAGPAGWAQPRLGDVFREYYWTKADGDAGGSLRVGGRVGYGGGPIPLPHTFDLEEAIRAEVVVEKLLCHDGTRGLAISINSNAWINLPEAPGIPVPQWDYQHHIDSLAPVPLAHLHASSNQFRMRVNDEHPWKWPQNLIYGVHVRIYYEAASKPHPTGKMDLPPNGAALGRAAELSAEAVGAGRPVRRVDFIGDYEDVNLEGDGQYSQWHYRYFKGVLTHHIGTATAPPWRVTWDTSWVPDQPRPFRLAARIADDTGLTYLTRPAEGLTLERDGLSVELCKPFDVPKKWVTRSGEKTQKFRVAGDLRQAVAAQLVWCSWSPGYMDGLFLNGLRVFDQEGPRYACYVHRIPLKDVHALRAGENVLKTGLTPKQNGQTVHGMEVNWPGIMLLIQYRR
ncbi:MAG TPA: hypothetical protein P5555_18385 [Candidatus Paceibacterota bacterium]|nr:hypothetical protein [Verrucomicrobiota bacterium]HOX04218.1 hypothetical protein [Verrucomicrobiota bacterium]HRZ47152.1 hypothetical protein [Candidatus Paceibacterota bacterium]HRZ92862.1 hypothetical protein [Candidatus Paceibacterota bacterium]